MKKFELIFWYQLLGSVGSWGGRALRLAAFYTSGNSEVPEAISLSCSPAGDICPTKQTSDRRQAVENVSVMSGFSFWVTYCRDNQPPALKGSLPYVRSVMFFVVCYSAFTFFPFGGWTRTGWVRCEFSFRIKDRSFCKAENSILLAIRC